MTENFANSYSTSINDSGGISNSDTTVTVTSVSGAPSVNFRLKCENELMLVTNISSNTLTITRGIEGTTAASHADGTLVTHVLTKGGLEAAFRDLAVTRVSRNASQNVTGSGTSTTVSWDSEIEDTHGLWVSGSPTVFTIPASLNGRHAQVVTTHAWSQSTAGSYRHAVINQNSTQIGAQMFQDPSAAVAAIVQCTSYIITLATNDTISSQFRVDTTGIGIAAGTNDTWMTLYTVD